MRSNFTYSPHKHTIDFTIDIVDEWFCKNTQFILNSNILIYNLRRINQYDTIILKTLNLQSNTLSKIYSLMCIKKSENNLIRGLLSSVEPDTAQNEDFE